MSRKDFHFSIKRRLYESTPDGLKSLVSAVPFPIIAGASYRAVMRDGRRVDELARRDVVALMEGRLGAALKHAVTHVPFYRPFREFVEHLPPAAALRHFPIVDKDMVISKFPQFLADPSVRSRHYETTTGGTSGRQLKLLLDDDSQPVEVAFLHRLWQRVGYTHRSRKATFRGVSFPRAEQGVYWRLNPIYREMQFSPMMMSEARLPDYWRRLVRYDPDYLHGYPSAISLLARHVLRNKLRCDGLRIKAALLGSEGCSPEQRDIIERAFRTRVFSWYGHSERLVLAGECERTSDYHHFPDYGWLEILDESGRAVADGERGEIVGTGFLNRVMSLIRYRTGDFATRLPPECECGRYWDRFNAVEGHRKQEMVIGRTGVPMSLAALNVHGPQFERVFRYQYYQDAPGFCEIRVMPDPDFTESDRRAIADAYASKVGDEVRFTVRVVADIPLTPRGKLKILDSHLDSAGSGDRMQ